MLVLVLLRLGATSIPLLSHVSPTSVSFLRIIFSPSSPLDCFERRRESRFYSLSRDVKLLLGVFLSTLSLRLSILLRRFVYFYRRCFGRDVVDTDDDYVVADGKKKT